MEHKVQIYKKIYVIVPTFIKLIPNFQNKFIKNDYFTSFFYNNFFQTFRIKNLYFNRI